MLHLLYTLLFVGTAAFAGAADLSPIPISLAPVDPRISSRSTEELVGMLRTESQTLVLLPGSGTSWGYTMDQPAFAAGFLPIAEPPFLHDNMRRRSQSPVMTELVKRGLVALPVLLQRLSDQAQTCLVTRGVDIGSIGFADHYDPRYQDPQRQPKGVNTVKPEGENFLSSDKAYLFTVGDLCAVAARSIVNRRAQPAGSFIGHVSVICSPTKYPALAAAMRADWGGLTAKEHEASLRHDVLESRSDGHRYPGEHFNGALQRLLFYYPDSGREVAESLLRQVIADQSPELRNSNAYFLLNELAAYQWDGLFPLVHEVFKKAAPVKNMEFIALLCAEMLAGHGYDGELAGYLTVLIPETKSEPVRNRYLALLKSLNPDKKNGL